MAGQEIKIITKLDELEVLFNQMKEVYFFNTPNQDLSALVQADIELPVLDDGVTFNTGDADVSKIKLTTGRIWTSVANAGDADIQFQIASVAGPITELFMQKKATTASMAVTLDGVTYEGEGFDFTPKKVKGAMLMRSEDRASVIYLPNVEGYSSFVSEKDKPGYFNTSWSPKADTHGAGIYFLRKKEAVAAKVEAEEA